MNITGTHFNYYMLCHRKLWLFANGISMEHTSDLVYAGKLLHESSYPQRAERYTEVEVEGLKIDFYDPFAKVVHEVKKSDSYEEAHEWQVKYYIYVLERNGVTGASGLLEYPKQRETHVVNLSEDDRRLIEVYVKEIESIVISDDCPARKEQKRCKNCSYFDFCWTEE
jgi:CRISPR-associated exonuclease Cas4